MIPPIQAALNGTRDPVEHPALPVHAAQLAADARSCRDAGCCAVHLHVRAPSGAESLDRVDVACTVAAVRDAAPGLPVGISTGAWIVPDPGERLALVGRWDVRPDFVSVNFHEEGAVALVELCLERGMAVEAGAIDADAAERLAASRLVPRCLRIVLEPQEPSAAAARANVEEMLRALARLPAPRAFLLHGSGGTVWPMLEEAARRRWETRVGLEDTLTLPDGSSAASNADLVSAARTLVARGLPHRGDV